MALRDTLNQSGSNQLADAFRDIKIGELLSYIVALLGFTETGITVTANIATLANAPTAMFQLTAATGTVTGVKKMLRGPISGEDAVIPITGEAVWDGGTRVLFAAADVVATASFTYARATNLASVTMRDMGQTGNV